MNKVIRNPQIPVLGIWSVNNKISLEIFDFLLFEKQNTNNSLFLVYLCKTK